ncbi:pentatricopeptide repeat-containing protein At2g46050, mitochondrial-like isoform X2 [Neltuma alba]|uniref:pentatricopeptide repeat-containing protein At2g46050, mitochondrial-like isoform X2 n=1 Tax=Neltuma alba TaxID=207710 RepID=UPI0010A4FFED|nr:pentatricopeptide repeat-containing protein At2g46050, mitochondrial-like isoform X2 [Prosopis alba]
MKIRTMLGSSIYDLHRIKFFPPSLPILHFKPSPFFVIVPQNYSYSSYQFHPLIQTNASPSVSRCRALVPVPDQTHSRDFNTVFLFSCSILQTCAKRAILSELKQVHGHLFKSGLYSVLSLQNQVLYAYFKCMESSDAEKVFEELRVRNVVSWNISIRVKLGLDLDCFVGSALVDFYAKCGLVQNARLVFSCVRFKDLVMWNVMISCYTSNCLPLKAWAIFNLMRLEGVKGDEFTYSSLISSCVASDCYDFGRQIHSLILKQSFDSDVSVATALINIYAKHENITDALRVFDKMVIRNVVSWNTLIVGCGQCGHGNEVMEILRNMLREETHPDDLTLSSTISSCGYASSITETKQAHALTIKSGLEESISVGNSLLTAYSKCGTIACAYKCFRSILQPDVISWTSMINAYAFHGLAQKANETFEKMLSCAIKPDKISFLGVLSACVHSGLVIKGLYYFKLMTKLYQIEPETEHYACIVDLLGRCGYIYEAFEFLRSMSIEPEGNTLGAFIGSCKVHEQIVLARWAAQKLLMIEPKKSVNYTVMSNIYACYKRWCEVERLRRKMEERCSSKVRGCSWIEIGNEISFFVSCDRSHPEALEVHATLAMLISTMKEDGVWIV